MDAFTSSVPAGGLSRGIGGIVVLVIGAIALYYLYQFLYGSSGLKSTAVITSAKSANPAPNQTLYTIDPMGGDGGEYSVSFWVYLTGFKDQLGTNKHVVEIRGRNMSTLVIGFGAFTNKLMVRVATASSPLTSQTVRDMFTARQIPGSIESADTMPICDLPEIDLQRWVCLSVVLNGRTIDVYLDGKLARSCVNKDMYKTDSTEMKIKLTDFNGFDGFISDVYTYQYALNPEQAYRIYMAGPSDIQQNNFVSWMKSIFNVEGSVTYQYPAVGVTYSKAELNF